MKIKFFISLPAGTRLQNNAEAQNVAGRRKKRWQGKPETFSFLCFVHICGMTKQD